MENVSGVRNGAKKLPNVDCTTVNASLPLAWPVIMTLDEMVVAVHPVSNSPKSKPASINSGFVAHAETIPKIVADVTR